MLLFPLLLILVVMRAKIILGGLLFLTFPGWAQLNNPSFELIDSLGGFQNWTSTQGRSTRMTVEQFGLIPLTAYQGNFFTLLESDTLSNPVKEARFTQTFPIADTPASFYLHHLYIPETTEQTAGVQLLMTRWNGSSRDTILSVLDTVHVVANGNQIPIQWNAFGTTLQGRYQLAQVPDTATITLTNNLTNSGKNIRWYVDDLSFGNWAVGLNQPELKLNIHLFPNPASDWIRVNTNMSVNDFKLYNMQGQEQNIRMEQLAFGSYRLLTDLLPNGVYILSSSSHSNFHQRIFIQH